MVGFTASWIHGHAVTMEQPPAEDGGVLAINRFGWGTQITMRPGFSRWFHIAIPAPVILDGKRMKLIRAFLQWRQIAGYAGAGFIQDVHMWDGQKRIALQSNKDFKESGFATLPEHSTYELAQPREWYFGLGLSFRLAARSYMGGHFIENRDAPVIVVGSAGADFDA